MRLIPLEEICRIILRQQNKPEDFLHSMMSQFRDRFEEKRSSILQEFKDKYPTKTVFDKMASEEHALFFDDLSSFVDQHFGEIVRAIAREKAEAKRLQQEAKAKLIKKREQEKVRQQQKLREEMQVQI